MKKIYLDQASTSFPKAPSVSDAVYQYLSGTSSVCSALFVSSTLMTITGDTFAISNDAESEPQIVYALKSVL